MSFLIPLLVGTFGILLWEWVTWILFRRKLAGLHFPREADASAARFFSVARIRLCAAVHTGFLIFCLCLLLLLYW